ncbi:hypothetical protein SFRURICE_014652 [Spodoptera frugiperda]|uniref:SFRICE_008149 n=1 Tax=Spodoptera frugiperda TaxID=7108 RepID=A0A2H1V2J0_SPOFR|nr:hypothetical protein SFRURICE_014652 [Spodoptera frugiperda]
MFNCLLTKLSRDLKLIELASGKKFCMSNDYTYSFRADTKRGAKWRCTGCNVFIIINCRDELIQISGNHNHKPPKYYVRSDGKYVKLL